MHKLIESFVTLLALIIIIDNVAINNYQIVCIDGTMLNKKMFEFKNWTKNNAKLGIEGSPKVPSTEVTIAITD